MKKLFGLVIERKEINKKLNYDEIFGKEFHPYNLIHQISEIEEGLWNHGYGRMQSMCASIRDRFQFLMTLSGCLRCESMYKTDLSDLCDLVYHQKSERSPYQILIMRTGEGKTVHDKNIFGRLLRHVDVRRCAFGALGLWLLSR